MSPNNKLLLKKIVFRGETYVTFFCLPVDQSFRRSWVFPSIFKTREVVMIMM